MRIKDLRLAVSVLLDDNQMQHLTHVYICRSELIASDGKRLVRIVDDFPEPEFIDNGNTNKPYFLVPKSAIEALIKKVGKGADSCQVTIGKGHYDRQYGLYCRGELEFFHPAEVSYPITAVDRLFEVLKNVSGWEKQPNTQFQWDLIEKAYKALGVWYGTKRTEIFPCSLNTVEENTMPFGWFAKDNATYIIMSRRM
jgi:hypothetical protein